MNIVAALSFLFLTADVQMTLAPDQPLAYVYADDPLIVELVSPEEATALVRLRLQPVDRPDAVEISLGDLQLPANAPRWCAVKDAPPGRGLHTVEATIEIRGAVQKKSARFCRVDRASSQHPLPICVTAGDEFDTKFLLALRSVGVTALRLDAGREGYAACARLASDLGFSVVAHVSQKSYATVAARLAGMNGKGPVPVRWEVEYAGDRGAFVGFAEAVAKSAGNAPVEVAVTDAAALEEFFAECGEAPVMQCVLYGKDLPAPGEVAAAKMLALKHGHEGWKVNVLSHGTAPEGVKGAQSALKRSLELLAAGASCIGMDARVVYTDGGLCDMAGYLNGMAVRFPGGEFAGMLPLADGVTAPLFRREGQWIAAFWSGTETDVSVALSGVVNPEITDGLGNPVEHPEVRDSQLAVKAGTAPQYLTGTGGVVPGSAAQRRAEETAGILLGDGELGAGLPAPLKDLVKAIQGDVNSAASRGRFLELVRYLPKIEEQWHGGAMPQHTAVPAMAEIAALARALCLVEDDRGEPFLEPMSDTIARCEELQSLYLTGSPARADERHRGEWLLREVRRLVDEAEALERAGRRVEASAVATLAQWRAECLPIAARATAAPVAPAAPAPEPPKGDEKKAEEEKDAKKDEVKSGEEKPAGDAPKKKPEEKEQPAAKEAPAKKAEVKEIVHTVVSGDNPSVIAGKYHIGLDELLAHNKMKKSVRLNIGDKVLVPAGSDKAKAVEKKSPRKKRR